MSELIFKIMMIDLVHKILVTAAIAGVCAWIWFAFNVVVDWVKNGKS